MRFTANKTNITFILIVILLIGISVFVSNRFFTKVNQSVDPRIVDAREAYQKYDEYTQANEFWKALHLLDSIETIYNRWEHYRNSYEIGVLNNNRGAIYLSLSMHKDSIALPGDNQIFRNYSSDSLLALAEQHIRMAIGIYTGWKNETADLNESDLIAQVKESFLKESDLLNKRPLKDYLKNRLDEIEKNKEEINRRLSVSYTNLGMVLRQKQLFDEAVQSYLIALNLWNKNLTAENNLNKLVGKPQVKRNFFQKMFPATR